MKAIVLRGFGGPEVLRLEEVPTPTPAAGEILVKVRSVSVNRTLDLIVRQGNYPVKVQLPHILGVDPVGVVAHVGTDTDNVKVGDRVAVLSFIACRKCRYCLRGEEANCLSSRHIGLHRWGGYAEYVTAPARNAFKLPDNVSFAEGTIVTRHFPMAFNLLASKADVKPGEWVLVMGATGALGSCCVQVAQMLGAKVVAGEVKLDVKRLYMRRLRIIGAAGTNLPDVDKALEAAEAGKIRAIIDRTMPLRDAAEAHRILERNQTLGKIILDPTQN